MSSPSELRESDLQRYEFGPNQPERFLGVDERDEALVAATAVLGPLATMMARTDTEAYRPMFAEARPPATVAEAANTVEFIPPYPEWRDEAKGHVATAAVMFASERPDLEVADDQYALAA